MKNWVSAYGHYRIAVWTPTKATPFSLVYGCEAVLRLEIQLSSLHTTLALETTKDNLKLCLQKLEVLDEKRLQAQQCIKTLRSQNLQIFLIKMLKNGYLNKGI